ncbi:MAG: hypothetical protein K6F33_00480 [Bacteroidales bacterium]|nr:hypothetical protein [Bacteroidales bacterium]
MEATEFGVKFNAVNILKKFKSASEITDEERKYAAKQIGKMTFSPNTNNLVEGLSINDEELKDERTRYILGIKQ